MAVQCKCIVHSIVFHVDLCNHRLNKDTQLSHHKDLPFVSPCVYTWHPCPPTSPNAWQLLIYFSLSVSLSF